MSVVNMNTCPQELFQKIPERKWDAIIIGAGPAGSTAAATLAEKGWKVLLLDKETMPREKVCGDALTPESQRYLQRLNVLDRVSAAGHRCERMSFYSPSGNMISLPSTFLCIPRKDLDTILACRACEMGATFARGSVSCVSFERDGTAICALREEQRAVHGNYVIMATGPDTTLLDAQTRSKQAVRQAVALRGYIASEVDIDSLIVSVDKSVAPGTGWIFPMGGGLYNVGVAIIQERLSAPDVTIRRCYTDFLQNFGEARRLMSKGEQLGKPKGHLIRYGLQGCSPIGQGNILLAGDTIGAALPLTFEGMSMAMRTGQLAAEAVDRALNKGDRRQLLSYPIHLNQLSAIHAWMDKTQGYLNELLENEPRKLDKIVWVLAKMDIFKKRQSLASIHETKKVPRIALKALKMAGIQLPDFYTKAMLAD